ncbi:MAG: hypothetical protein CW338_02260 [Clostridiales bacterium]|nr:hypothetical protein [Clostridiales bacterium]
MVCGRYYLPEEDLPQEWLNILKLLGGIPEGAKTAGEISPGDIVPAIANDRSLSPRPFFMRWGYSMENASSPGGKLIFNARSETAAEKPMFRESMAARRCLIPAVHYFEWEKRQEWDGIRKVKHILRPEGNGVIYLCGIYRIEQNRAAFTILTKQADDNIAFIHDRMPLILPRNCIKAWLKPQTDPADLLQYACRVQSGEAAV